MAKSTGKHAAPSQKEMKKAAKAAMKSKNETDIPTGSPAETMPASAYENPMGVQQTERFAAVDPMGAGQVVSPITYDDKIGASGPGKSHGHGGLKVLATIAIILGVIYLGGAFWFSGHFMPRTTINDKDVSLKSVEEVASGLTDTTSNYKVAVTGDGLNLTVAGSDIDLALDANSYAKDAIGQINYWAWPYEVTKAHSISENEKASYDTSKLETILTQAIDTANSTASQPTNATIGFDATAAKYVVQSEVYGTAIDSASAIKNVEDVVSQLGKTVELGTESLIQPTVTKDNASLQTAADAANTYLKASITLTLGGTNVKTVDANVIKDWITLGDDLSATFDTDKVTEWAKGSLSDELDTIGTSRTYVRPSDNATITVSGGTYGWNIDGASLADQIVDAIKTGSTATIDIPTKQSAAVWTSKGAADWGSFFIDIDLTAQHVRLFKDGSVIWESDCVSGNTSEDHATPEGVYAITDSMASGNIKLTGKMLATTGQPEYISYVSYWMPFIDNSYALHDATWRSTFGGSVYATNGSHGCVNLPYSAAQELYGLVSVGTPVIVHA